MCLVEINKRDYQNVCAAARLARRNRDRSQTRTIVLMWILILLKLQGCDADCPNRYSRGEHRRRVAGSATAFPPTPTKPTYLIQSDA